MTDTAARPAPPVIGAALPVEALPRHRDWLFEKDRDLELQSFHAPDLLISGDWGGLVDTARRHLEGYGGRLGIHGPFWGLHLANPDREIREIVSRRILTGLDVCAALGAVQMVIHSPYSTWDHNNLDSDPQARDRVIALVHDTLSAAVVRAEAQGVTLVIENIEDVDPDERRRLAESFASPAVRLSIDTGHAQYAHGATGAPPVDHFVLRAGAMLGHVHLQDADGHADRHWAIGEGSVPWAAVFRALGRIEARPHLVLELRDDADIPASMAWLAARGLAQ